MKPERLEEIRALLARTTPPPWRSIRPHPQSTYANEGRVEGEALTGRYSTFSANIDGNGGAIANHANADFIAACPDIVRELVEAVDLANRKVAAAVDDIDAIEDAIPCTCAEDHAGCLGGKLALVAASLAEAVDYETTRIIDGSTVSVIGRGPKAEATLDRLEGKERP